MLFIYLTTLFIAPQLWVEPIYGLPVDYIVYPLWMLALVVSRQRNPMTWAAEETFFLLLVIWIPLTMIFNGGFHGRSTDIIINYSKWFVLYKLVYLTISSPERFKTLAHMLIFFALLLAVEGIQHYNNPAGLGWAGQTLSWVDPDALAAGVPGRTRWIGIFDGPGVFCVVYTIALPFLLQYLTTSFRFSVRLLATGLLGLLFVAIFFNGSRGGLLTALAVIALFAALRYKVSLSKIIPVAGLIVLVFMLAPSYLTTMDDQSKSASHRVDMWAEGVEMVEQNPVFGIGKGNFVNYTGKLIAHNSAIEVMGETGVPGLFLWFGLIYFSLKNIFLYLRIESDEQNRSYATALALSVFGYMISALFVTLEYETFYFLLGTAASFRSRLEDPPSMTLKELFWIFCGTLGWILFIKSFVMLYG